MSTHWDLAGFFPDEEGRPERFLRQTEQQLHAFAAATSAELTSLSELIESYEAIEIRLRHLAAYVLCLESADVDDPLGPELRRWCDEAMLKLYSASDPLLRRLARATTPEADALAQSLGNGDGRAKIEQLRRAGKMLLPPDDERLLARLELSAVTLWGRLARQQFAQGILEYENGSGQLQSTPYPMRAAALTDADPAARRGVYAAVQNWAAARRDMFALAFNARAGAYAAICDRREESVVAATARRHCVSEHTLTRLMRNVAARRPKVWPYARLKARALGLKQLQIFDRTALLPGSSAPESSEVLRAEIDRAFRRVWPDMARSMLRVSDRGWLDAFPRPRKGGVGLCVWSPITGEPRVLTAYDGSLASATIFAHEHGHAFHGEELAAVRPSLREAPSPITETFAILAELIFRDGLLASEGGRFGGTTAAFAGELDAAFNYLVRIPRDYAAELAFHEARRAAELSADDFCALSRAAFRDWLGPATTATDEDEYVWITNHYFYIEPFFNWAYTFAYIAAAFLSEQLDQDSELAQHRVRQLIRAAARQNVDEAFAEVFAVDPGSEDFVAPAYKRILSYLEQFRAALDGTR